MVQSDLSSLGGIKVIQMNKKRVWVHIIAASMLAQGG